MTMSPPADLSAMPPAFQAGYTAGAKDARQHRKRNRVLDELHALTAFAGDAALAYCPTRNQKAHAELIARYVEGYVRAYRAGTGQ